MHSLWAVCRPESSRRYVTVLLVTLTGAANCQEPAQVRYTEPVRLASLADPQIVESSGLGASWRNPGLYWTHNDSGGGPFVYAFDRSGAARGAWRVRGAKARDWEDMAVGPGPEPEQWGIWLSGLFYLAQPAHGCGPVLVLPASRSDAPHAKPACGRCPCPRNEAGRGSVPSAWRPAMRK